MTEKNYQPLFCEVTFTKDGFTVMPCKEDDESEYADVCIPLEHATTIFGITCYITNKSNAEPAIAEMLVLKDQAENLYKAIMARAN